MYIYFIYLVINLFSLCVVWLCLRWATPNVINLFSLYFIVLFQCRLLRNVLVNFLYLTIVVLFQCPLIVFLMLLINFLYILLSYFSVFIISWHFLLFFQCRLIVSQMSNTKCEIMNWLLFPLALCLVIIIVFPSLEVGTLIIMSITATVAHIHYGVYVVSVMLCYVF